jgi:serine/threonine protein phosphatase PrpC
LWGVVAEEKIAQLVANTTDLQQTCQLLIDAANESGGPDNITAILVHLPGLQN